MSVGAILDSRVTSSCPSVKYSARDGTGVKCMQDKSLHLCTISLDPHFHSGQRTLDIQCHLQTKRDSISQILEMRKVGAVDSLSLKKEVGEIGLST